MSDDNSTSPQGDERRPRSTRWNDGGRASAGGAGASRPDAGDESRRDGSRQRWSRDERSSGDSERGRGAYDRREERPRAVRDGRRDDTGGRDRAGYRRTEGDGRRYGSAGGPSGGYRPDEGRRGSAYGRDSRGDGRRQESPDRERRGSGYGERGRDERQGWRERGGYGERRDERSFSTGRRADGSERSGRREDPRTNGDRREGVRREERGGFERRGDERRGGFANRSGGGAPRDGRSGDRYGERRGEEGGRAQDRGGFARGGDRASGWSDEQSNIRGPRSWDPKSSGDERPRRKPEPVLPEGITGYELDKAVRQQLRTLSKENAEGVAQHLVAAAELLDDDPQKALDHAQHAVSRAGRVPAVREALGLVLYRTGEYAEALREFRTARRLSGSDHLLPYMVDCERGLGRYERALELANSPEAQRLTEADNIELAIVVSGVRRDMGQARAAVVGLRIPALTKATTQPWAARLFYAYADALLALGETAEAREWFAKADAADRDGETDAADRIDQIDGFEVSDLTPEEDQRVDPRFAELDLSAFGAVQPSSDAPAVVATGEGFTPGGEGFTPGGEGFTPGDEGEQGGVEEPRTMEPRQAPSASFDDGSARD